MNTIYFILKQHWYDEMVAGRKDIEYREITPYWKTRLTTKPLAYAIFSAGYTKQGRFIRPITKIDIGPCPYPNWSGNFYRIHLGPLKFLDSNPNHLSKLDKSS